MLTISESDISINRFERRGRKQKLNHLIIYLLFIILFLFLFIYFRIFNLKLNQNFSLNQLNNIYIINLKDDIFKKVKYLENMIKRKDILNDNSTIYDFDIEEFDEKFNQKYIESQQHFCTSNNLFLDSEVEKKIIKTKSHLNNIEFEIFVYKSNDIVSNSIINTGSWEIEETKNLLNCLDYYSKKKKLFKNKVMFLDIGANVGWHSFFLGKAGYEIIAFEASNVNNYILKKNFCLNNDIKITIINKGIGLKNEKCLLDHPLSNIGNGGIISCLEQRNITKNNKKLIEEVKITKLSNYINFLSKKNLGLIKIDIEGAEGKAIISGIELITKYHVPFLFIEFAPYYMKLQGTDPKFFLELFLNNGYKISKYDFLSKKYSSIDELLKIETTNLYFIYSKFLE